MSQSCIVTGNRLSEGYCGLPIRVRAGLHAGEALRHENDFYGRTVVIAARISALALGNEILASDLVHTLAIDVGTFTFGEPRSTSLKGLEEALRSIRSWAKPSTAFVSKWDD